MSDPRHELQATFAPSKRYDAYGEALLRVHIMGFRNHTNTVLSIESPITALCGVNGTGKSTVLQLAASAYQASTHLRYYVSSFILAGNLDSRPFAEDASVEFTYAEAATADGEPGLRTLTVSRSGSSWTGYDRQPTRHVTYLGSNFYVPHAERDSQFKALLGDSTFLRRDRRQIDNAVIEKVSRILLCKYDAAHVNSMRKKYARRHTRLITARRDGGAEYSEANMGSGEARLYALATTLETTARKSLVLIEEPETALHPCAQFELGKYLIDVAIRRGVQIILTTHSEYVLLSLPQKSRVYLKRDAAGVVPIPGVGVRQAVSMMDGLAIPALHILVEDDVAEAIVVELLRKHDPDFLKTVHVVVAGSDQQIRQMMEVFKDQLIPICAVRDGDCAADRKSQMFKLFGTGAPEKEIFGSKSFRDGLEARFGVDWGAIDLSNSGLDHHRWFNILERHTALKRPELLPVAARAYLDGVPETDRTALVEQIKASIP